jgi:SAM-dependent methyltransferase
MQTMDQQYWDDLYGSREQLFSGNPNGMLVTEIRDLAPGRALDVGCGEGADARWLADQGWLVTAVDISQTAITRAAAVHSNARIAWTRADLARTPPPVNTFDLVSAQYFPLAKANPAQLHDILAAVAPGGTLLVVGHSPDDLPPDSPFDRNDFYWPAEIAELLDGSWTITVNETRPRTAPAPAGTTHRRDTVLRATKRPA